MMRGIAFMDNNSFEETHFPHPRRKKRSKFDIFKEVYLLPLVIFAVLLLIFGIVLNQCTRQKETAPTETTLGAEVTDRLALQAEATAIMRDAIMLADDYDYDGALSALYGFSGNLKDFPEIAELIDSYTQAKNSLVVWTGRDVPNLSFHVLIEDLDAALKDSTYGKKGNDLYNRNFITTTEFAAILQQLHDNGYLLVSLSDLYDYAYDSATGQMVYTEKELRLPFDRKPLLLTETHCTYYHYMDGAGFASKLKYNGQFYNEKTASDGSTVSGKYDLVPILEDFIQRNPDFSYRGARAILAFSGYNGIFGYQIQSDNLTGDALKQEQQEAKALCDALREAGYTLACYSYRNLDYQLLDAEDIREDLEVWDKEIASVIGATDVMVFARESDIGTDYANNAKFDVLYNAGYRFFLGSSAFLYHQISDQYVRHNRLMVTGSTLAHYPERFEGILNPETILDSRRGTIPK